MKQTISNSMNPVNQSCPSTFKDYNRFSVKHAPNDYRIPYLQGGDFAQRGLGLTTGIWNNDNLNGQQAKQIYGDMNYNYINRDTYSGRLDEIMDIERNDITSAHQPYYLPDRSQYPLYQWQNNYSAFRNFETTDLYQEQGKKRLSDIQTNKDSQYKQKYRK